VTEAVSTTAVGPTGWNRQARMLAAWLIAFCVAMGPAVLLFRHGQNLDKARGLASADMWSPSLGWTVIAILYFVVAQLVGAAIAALALRLGWRCALAASLMVLLAVFLVNSETVLYPAMAASPAVAAAFTDPKPSLWVGVAATFLFAAAGLGAHSFLSRGV
jgi:hypothetical protein